MATNKTKATLAHTEEFISSLADETEVLELIPEVFIDQARAAASAFYVDESLLSRSQYQTEDGSHDLIRIVLEDPKDHGEGLVSVKIRLSGRMDPDTGDLVPMNNRGTSDDSAEWIKGFRSGRIGFSPDSVEAGIISESDYNNIVRYAQLWEEITEAEGPNSMYTKEHAKKRLWFTASDEDALLTFEMETRTNPNNEETAIGITNVAFRNLEVIGIGTAQAPADLSLASNVKTGKSKLSIPNFRTKGSDDAPAAAIPPRRK